MKKLKILFFVIFIFACIICSYYIIIKPITNTIENNGSEYMGFGFYQKNNNTITPFNNTLYVNNGSFDGYMVIDNHFNHENQYLILAFLDYNAIPFYYNGTVSTIHIVNMSPMGMNHSYFNITNIPNGFHDILFLVFLDPYNHSLDEVYRLDTDYSDMGRWRFNVVFKNDLKPLIQFKNVYTDDNNSNKLNGVLVTKDTFSDKIFLSKNVTPNETLNYFINIGNKRNISENYAIIQLLDYNQIPINYNESNYVYYGSIKSGERSSIPVNIKIPDSNGVHELIIIWTTNPYENIWSLNGTKNNMQLDSIPSARIGLNVIINQNN